MESNAQPLPRRVLHAVVVRTRPPPPPHRALLKFDICTAIFTHLEDDTPALIAAALTCQAWAAAAVPIRWRAPPSDVVIAARLYRAAVLGPVIRRLKVQSSQHFTERLDSAVAASALQLWPFPGLRQIEVDVDSLAAGAMRCFETVIECSSGDKVTAAALRSRYKANYLDSWTSGEVGGSEAAAGGLVEKRLVLRALRVLAEGCPALTSLVVEVLLVSGVLDYFAAAAYPATRTADWAAAGDARGAGGSCGRSDIYSTSCREGTRRLFRCLQSVSASIWHRGMPALTSMLSGLPLTTLEVCFMPEARVGIQVYSMVNVIDALDAHRETLTVLRVTFTSPYTISSCDMARSHGAPHRTAVGSGRRLCEQFPRQRAYLDRHAPSKASHQLASHDMPGAAVPGAAVASRGSQREVRVSTSDALAPRQRRAGPECARRRRSSRDYV